MLDEEELEQHVREPQRLAGVLSRIRKIERLLRREPIAHLERRLDVLKRSKAGAREQPHLIEGDPKRLEQPAVTNVIELWQPPPGAVRVLERHLRIESGG